MKRNTFQSVLGLVVWVALCFIAAAAGGQGSLGAAHIYSQLNQPSWAPPSWLFAPVWTVLYLLMGVAAWTVWNATFAAPGLRQRALVLFVVQLALNALWSWLFFAWRQGAWAFAEILLLWLFILVTFLAFWRVRRIAGILLLPYLLWVTFAAALTNATWRMNPLLLGG